MADLPITIRPIETAEDRHYVEYGWLHSYRRTLSWMPRPEYWDRYRVPVRRALDRCMVLLACRPETPELIYAWVCGDPAGGLLHYVATKGDYRRCHLATRLVAELVSLGGKKLTATHWTELGQLLLDRVELIDGYRPDLFDPREIRNANRKGPARDRHRDRQPANPDRPA